MASLHFSPIVLLLAAALAVPACDRHLPTEPSGTSTTYPRVAGTWNVDPGEGEDTGAYIEIRQEAGSLTGRDVSADGVAMSFTGWVQRGSMAWSYLPDDVVGTSDCPSLTVSCSHLVVTADGLATAADCTKSGRCPNTVWLSFRLVRK